MNLTERYIALQKEVKKQEAQNMMDKMLKGIQDSMRAAVESVNFPNFSASASASETQFLNAQANMVGILRREAEPNASLRHRIERELRGGYVSPYSESIYSPAYTIQPMITEIMQEFDHIRGCYNIRVRFNTDYCVAMNIDARAYSNRDSNFLPRFAHTIHNRTKDIYRDLSEEEILRQIQRLF